jgi:hypothetical protein
VFDQQNTLVPSQSLQSLDSLVEAEQTICLHLYWTEISLQPFSARQASTAEPTRPSFILTTSLITSRSKSGNMPCSVLNIVSVNCFDTGENKSNLLNNDLMFLRLYPLGLCHISARLSCSRVLRTTTTTGLETPRSIDLTSLRAT